MLAGTAGLVIEDDDRWPGLQGIAAIRPQIGPMRLTCPLSAVPVRSREVRQFMENDGHEDAGHLEKPRSAVVLLI